MPIRQRYHYQDSQGLEVEGAKVGRFDAGINTNFIVYRIGDTLIDCGPSNQWPEVKAFVSEREVKHIWITHHHEDHSGNGGKLSKLFEVTPFAPIQAREKLEKGFKTPLMQRIIWGKPQPVTIEPLPETLTLSDGSPVIPVHTPGHAKDLTCFYLPKQKWFFSGDLYIAKGLKFFRSDENLQQLMSSLAKALSFDFEVIFCPHKGIEENGHQALTEKLDNLLQLCIKAQNLQQQGLSSEQISLKLLGAKEPIERLSRGNISKLNLINQALVVDITLFQ